MITLITIIIDIRILKWQVGLLGFIFKYMDSKVDTFMAYSSIGFKMQRLMHLGHRIVSSSKNICSCGPSVISPYSYPQPLSHNFAFRF